METRASYIVVGGFVLAMLAGALAVVLWVAGTRTDEATTEYEIIFAGSVTGLRLGNAVLYRGFPVGTVADIGIDPVDNFIVVTVEIDADTPIKVDTEALLELQLITNIAVVQLIGGSPDSPPLEPEPGADIAVIRAGKSAFEALSEGAPELVADLNTLIQRAQMLFSDRNLKNIEGIIADVNTLTGTFADKSDKIESMIDDVTVTLNSLTNTMHELSLFVEQVRRIAEEQGAQLEPTVTQLQKTMAAFDKLATNLNNVVSENKRSLQDFSSTGLYELSRFLTEARTLVAALQRLSERMERDPARFLFGDSQRGVNVQ